MRYLLCAFVLLLTACGGTRTQAQAASNARAGAQALQRMLPTNPAFHDLALGVAHYVIAATENSTDLPPPQFTPIELLHSSSDYVAKAEIAAANPPPATQTDKQKKSILGTLGDYLLWGGGIALTIGGFMFITGWLKSIADEVILAGVASLVFGAILSWLGEHMWVLYVSALMFATIYAVRHRGPLLKTLAPFVATIKRFTKTHKVTQ